MMTVSLLPPGRRWRPVFLSALVLLLVSIAALAWVTTLPADRLMPRTGTWKGLHNSIAPSRGLIFLNEHDQRQVSCSIEGHTRSVSTGSWVFNGEATVRSCRGSVAADGSLAAELVLELRWVGRAKGMGGDWEDIRGRATCSGRLVGASNVRGKWRGRCEGQSESGEVSWEDTVLPGRPTTMQSTTPRTILGFCRSSADQDGGVS